MSMLLKTLKSLPFLVGTVTIGAFAVDSIPRYFYHVWNTQQIDLLQKYGPNSYGVVTGGSKGLGKEYAVQLATRGFNILLVARGIEALEETQKELKERFPNIDVKTAVCDLSSSDPATYSNLINQLKSLDIGVVINNVGQFQAGQLDQANPKSLKDMLATNVSSVTYLTHEIIPQMLQRKNTRSLIINVSSEAGDYEHKDFPPYCATKSYINHLTRSLQAYYEGSNIDFALFLPGPTDTPLLKAAAPDFKLSSYGKTYCADPANAAKEAFRKIGYQSEIYGDGKHEFMHLMYKRFRPVSELLYPQKI